MNDYQENRLTMYNAVRDFIAANETALSELPSFATFSGAFADVVSQIENIRVKQKRNIDGIALSKSEVKEALITRAYTISRKLIAIAAIAGNSRLKSEIDYTKSELRIATDTALKDICVIIGENANTCLEELEEFKITADAVEAFQTLVTTFSDAIRQPKNAASERKMITDKLKVLFVEGDALLKNKIDVLLATIEDEDLTLYKAYRRARTLSSEYGSRKQAVKVQINDTAGLPIRNVDATVVGSPITKKTSEKGGFHIDHMPEGVYTFNFRSTGYKPVSETVIVRDGELARVNIVMESILENVSA